MMMHQGGSYNCSASQNSKFELLKLVLVDFSQSKTIEHPPMCLGGVSIWLQEAHRFIGVMMDQGLRWNWQADHTLTKATKWTLAFCCLTRPSMGVGLKLM